MRIIVFNGSPRQSGNTEILLNEAMRGIKEAGHDIKALSLNLMNIRPCQDCGGCNKTGICVLDDEMNEIYSAIRETDRIILASPIFFFGLSAQAKAMIDRCQSFWCEKYLMKKPIPERRHGRKGLLLLVGGMMKEIGVQCSEATAKAFFRTISVPQHETLSILGVDSKGAILEHPEALEKAYQAGKNLTTL